jgi:hypothetical protein
MRIGSHLSEPLLAAIVESGRLSQRIVPLPLPSGVSGVSVSGGGGGGGGVSDCVEVTNCSEMTRESRCNITTFSSVPRSHTSYSWLGVSKSTQLSQVPRSHCSFSWSTSGAHAISSPSSSSSSSCSAPEESKTMLAMLW